ncbi:phosphotransferase family protein [Nocardioides terrisoli]|uniref:phosphotransferase family protein n=1 Tax=Nocardioides terrisoli TaxID=3388267 RepID=UPI00287B763D|nr:phosphotransferase family protein [Nocardioides marmorisolisilvae]
MADQDGIEIEGAGAVRAEDAFDVDAVLGWLRAQGEAIDGDVMVRQFGGGASNLTYSLRSTGPDGGRDLILRRPPSGHKARGAHDMGREFRIQAALAEPFGLVPTMVALCEDPAVIGSEFYVMERLDGIIPRRDLPPEVQLTETEVRRLCTDALDTLIRLHRVDVSAPDLAALGKGTGYVARQVAGWSTRWRQAVTPDAPDFEAVIGWLDAHQPEDVGNCLIHNDFRFDNLVLDRSAPTRVIGVLDWEMATLGDPLMDLGGTLAYWVRDDDDQFFRQFRRQPTHLPGMLSRDEVVAYYCDATGLPMTPDRWRFYEVYGLFRLGVISQQIYYRYFHGQTHNEAFAVFGPATQYLRSRCVQILGLAD